MNRQQKINQLRGIRDGLLTPEDLTPKVHGMFLKHEEKYFNNGKEYSESEFDKLLKALEMQNERVRKAGINEEFTMIIL